MHWTRLAIRVCYREKKVPNKDLTETAVRSLSDGHIVVKPREKLHGLAPASFEIYQIVICTSWSDSKRDYCNRSRSASYGVRPAKAPWGRVRPR